MKRFLIIIGTVAVGDVVLLLCAYFIFSSPAGSELFSQFLLKTVTQAESVSVAEVDGAFNDGVLLQDVEFQDIKGLPEGSILRVQKLSALINVFDFGESVFEAENIRLKMPHSEPVMLHGRYSEHILDANFYSRSLDARELIDVFRIRRAENISGSLNDVDILVSGPIAKISLDGSFFIEELKQKQFSLRDVPGTVALLLDAGVKGYQPSGVIKITGGIMNTPKVPVILSESTLVFEGSFENPRLNVKGTAVVQKTKINIVVTGTVKKPELALLSVPPVSQDKLLIMLATGQSWQGVERSVTDQKMTPELAKDFLDYFVFADTGNRLAKRLGLKDISLIYTGKATGIGLEKELTTNLGVGYEIKQVADGNQSTGVDQIIRGDLQVTENVTIGVGKEIRKIQPLPGGGEHKITDDKVTVEYQKKF